METKLHRKMQAMLFFAGIVCVFGFTQVQSKAKDVFIKMTILDNPDVQKRGIIYETPSTNPFIKINNAIAATDPFYVQLLSQFILDDGKKIRFTEIIKNNCEKIINDDIIAFGTHALKNILVENRKINANATGDEIKNHLKKELAQFLTALNDNIFNWIATPTQGIPLQDNNFKAIKELFNKLTFDEEQRADYERYQKNFDALAQKINSLQGPTMNLKDNYSDLAKPSRNIYFALKRLGESFGFELDPDSLDSTIMEKFKTTVRGNKLGFTLAAAGVGALGLLLYNRNSLWSYFTKSTVCPTESQATLVPTMPTQLAAPSLNPAPSMPILAPASFVPTPSPSTPTPATTTPPTQTPMPTAAPPPISVSTPPQALTVPPSLPQTSGVPLFTKLPPRPQ